MKLGLIFSWVAIVAILLFSGFNAYKQAELNTKVDNFMRVVANAYPKVVAMPSPIVVPVDEPVVVGSTVPLYATGSGHKK